MERMFFCILVVAWCCIMTAPVNGVRCYACTGDANITQGCLDPIDPNAPGVLIDDSCLKKCYTQYAYGGVQRGCVPPGMEIDNTCSTGDDGIKRCVCDKDLCNAASSNYYVSTLLSVTRTPVNGVRCYVCGGHANFMQGCMDPFDPNTPGVQIADNCLNKCYHMHFTHGGVSRGCLYFGAEFNNACSTGDDNITRCVCDKDLCNAASSNYYVSTLPSVTRTPVNGVRCYACTGNANITKGCIDPIDPNAPGVRIVDNCLGKCYTRYAEGGVQRGCAPPGMELDNKCSTGDDGIKKCVCDKDLCNAASSNYYVSTLFSVGIALSILLIQRIA
ncbi:uncharacterized protein LOC127837516 isoform X2 [Dreissena polymorpha]|uniref:uncharacterized protein LOC127837516 isoform X2 n=1 Tax=Dreissena polymorpha TaxID=45954 RepID=UPI002264AE0F|nr:uncharacterized protein LOC127837516 isoform X2 [Dreissena polymorpha]